VPRRLPDRPFLYAIVDTGRLGARAAGDAAAALARGGAALVQLRAKDVTDRRLLALAEEVRDGARREGALFIVNDRPDVARLVAADGVHLGQGDVPPAAARAVLGEGAIVGRSTHSLAQLQDALREPVDYVALGPVFATSTKADTEPVVGVELLRRARALTERPLVAIGGIDLSRAADVVAAGADGLAVISALLDAPDLEQAARAFVQALLPRRLP
jgi:thiamine-phosphate pyrophosphorylase